MTKNRIRIFFIALTALICAAAFLTKTTAQKRGDNFSHRTAAHARINCNSCHKVPTANWQSARQFPDVADYPDHDSCIRCHRADFFRSNRPSICAICHVNVSPRGEARFAFPLPGRSQEFSTIFPHNVHQDIIASLRKNYDVAVAHFVNVRFELAAKARAAEFNNCTICHKTMTGLPQYAARIPSQTQPLAEAAAETFTAQAEFFKDAPNNHASCFSCHYQSQKPVSTNCAGCHARTAPYLEAAAVQRYSLKFDHQEKNHAEKDCMSCHVRIVQNSDVRSLKDADVPILTCSTSACHGDELSDELAKREKSIAEKQAVFQCAYCHTSAIGRFQAPSSHRK